MFIHDWQIILDFELISCADWQTFCVCMMYVWVYMFLQKMILTCGTIQLFLLQVVSKKVHLW